MLKIKGPIKLPVGLIDGNVVEFNFYFTKRDGKRYIILEQRNKKGSKDIFLRIESACIFGHVIGSLRCDCGFQLKKSLNIIGNNAGLLIYSIDDDGRGLGIEGHFDTYVLRQIKLLETEDVYKKIGRSIDERDYDMVVDILKFFKIQKVKLLTNNSNRVNFLVKKGFKVRRFPLEMRVDEYSAPALMDKKDHLHYLFSFDSHLENFKLLLNNINVRKNKYSFLVTRDFYERIGIYSFNSITDAQIKALDIATREKRTVFYFNYLPNISFVLKMKKTGVLSIILKRDDLTSRQLATIRSEIGFIELVKVVK